MTKKNIKIFCASSDDVKDERKQSVIVLTRLEKVHKHLDLEPVHWEHDINLGSQSHNSTIQDEINRKLKKSKIVVFIFYKKLGVNTLKEFELAKKKRKKIFIFFKDIDGEQIKEVEDFKAGLNSSILYITYKTVQEYDTRLYEELNKYLTKKYPRPVWLYLFILLAIISLAVFLFKKCSSDPPCQSNSSGGFIAIAEFNTDKENNDLSGQIVADLEPEEHLLNYKADRIGNYIDSIDSKKLLNWLHCHDTGIVIYGKLQDINNKSFRCQIRFYNYKNKCNIQITDGSPIVLTYPDTLSFSVPATSKLVANFVKAVLHSFKCEADISNKILQKLESDTNYKRSGDNFKAYCNLLKGNNYARLDKFNVADTFYKAAAYLNPSIEELIRGNMKLLSVKEGIFSDKYRIDFSSRPVKQDSQFVKFIILKVKTLGITYKNKGSVLDVSVENNRMSLVGHAPEYAKGIELKPGSVYTDTIYFPENTLYKEVRRSGMILDFIPEQKDNNWSILLAASIMVTNVGEIPIKQPLSDTVHFSRKDHLKSFTLSF